MGDAESRLLDLIEMTYHAADDATMVQAVFVGLHDRMPFPTASFSPVATNTLVLQDGLCFEFVSTCGSDNVALTFAAVQQNGESRQIKILDLLSNASQ